jgi:hypothetical protein
VRALAADSRIGSPYTARKAHSPAQDSFRRHSEPKRTLPKTLVTIAMRVAPLAVQMTPALGQSRCLRCENTDFSHPRATVFLGTQKENTTQPQWSCTIDTFYTG